MERDYFVGLMWVAHFGENSLLEGPNSSRVFFAVPECRWWLYEA